MKRFFASLMLLIAPFAIGADADERPDNKKLAQCTKIEVLHIDPGVLVDAANKPYGRDTPPKDIPSYFIQIEGYWCRLLGTKSVEGTDAKSLAQSWRELAPKVLPPPQPGHARGITGMAACHTPPFAYRFYSGDTLLAESTVCWHCLNFSVLADSKRVLRSFDPTAKPAKDLLNQSNALFPQTPK